MPDGRNIIPKPDVPPEDMPWARNLQSDLSNAMDDIDSLKSNTVADYKQVNAATTASINQIARVRNYTRSIPYTDSRSTVAGKDNPVYLPANTWTKVIETDIPIPANKNKFALVSTATISLNSGSQNPSIWFSFFPGVSPSLESPMDSALLSPGNGQADYYIKMANATSSIEYKFAKNTGGAARISLSLWCASAVSLTGQATLTYNLIAGGQA